MAAAGFFCGARDDQAGVAFAAFASKKSSGSASDF
jgi:hypothetical protein